MKVRIKIKRRNLESSISIKESIINKRIKINNKSSNRNFILLASPLFIVYNIINFFKKKEIDFII